MFVDLMMQCWLFSKIFTLNTDKNYKRKQVNYNGLYHPSEGQKENWWEFLKIKNLFSKLKSDFGLVDSLVNLLIKMWVSKEKSTSTERKGKRGSSKETMKRTKSQKLHSKNVYQVRYP